MISLRHARPDVCATMLECIILALAIELGLRVTSIAALLHRLDHVRPGAFAIHHPVTRLAHFVAATYRLLPLPPTCLRESLLLYALLRRRGASPRLCLGVRKAKAKLEAHAWIEGGDRSLTPQGQAFLELYARPWTRDSDADPAPRRSQP